MTTIPTLSQLYTSTLTNLSAEYGSPISLIGRVFLRALSAVQAGKLKLFYLAVAFVQKNVFVDTADSEFQGGTLERFGRIKLKRNPFPAVAGQYEVEVTGNVGATIPGLTTFKSDDDSQNPGKMFMLDNDFVLPANPALIIVRALEGGVDSKLTVGNTLTATAPIINVNKSAEVMTETVQPIAAEELEDYRRKIEESFSLEPNGGSASDYRLWSADAQGVAKVYPYSKAGFPGELNLFVEATVVDSTDGKGTPSPALLLQVEQVVELDPDISVPIAERGRRPLGVHQVHYLPIVLQTIDIDITGLSALPPSDKDAIEAATIEMINKVRPFITAADVAESKNDILDVNRIIVEILNVVPGASFGPVVLKVNTFPVISFTFTNGQIPWVNNVNFL